MRLLHTMIRTGDLDRSIDFYTHILGMKLLRRKDYPEGKFTLAFVGYGDESAHSVIELTYNWGVAHYDLAAASDTSPSRSMMSMRRLRKSASMAAKFCARQGR